MLVILFPVTAETAGKPVGPPLEKVTIVYAGTSSNQAPGWVAYEAGFFRKYGLDVQLIHVVGGPNAVQVLLSGDAVVAQVSGPPALQSNLHGSDIVFIAGILNTMAYQFLVDKNIQRPDQLKDKTLAVSQFGSSSDFATRYALDKYGLVPGKDVSIVEIGSQPDRFAALQAGRIQGTMLEMPLTLKAKKMGLRVLADLQMLGLEYQATGLATTQALIKSRPELLRIIMKAYVEAIHYYKTHRDKALAILQKYLRTDDREALVKTYEGIGLTLLPEKPYPTPVGIQMTLRELATKEPKAQTARPEQFVDLTFVKELDTSGFIDRLYKATPVVATREDARSSSASVVIKQKAPPAKKSASTVPGASDPPKEYTVKAGDTLRDLALRFYGSSNKWAKIYQANAKTLENPNYIYIGQQLLIPAEVEPGT